MKKNKPPKRSVHLSIGKDLMDRLKEFSENRENTMTETMVYALNELFTYESIHPLRDSVMRDVVERKFSLPKEFNLRSFWLFLYLLSERYGDKSSKGFWGDVIYLSGIDKTHKEIYTEIYDESNRLYKIALEKEKRK